MDEEVKRARDLLAAVNAHLAARDALEDTPVGRLSVDDPRFATVSDTLAALREAAAKAALSSAKQVAVEGSRDER